MLWETTKVSTCIVKEMSSLDELVVTDLKAVLVGTS